MIKKQQGILKTKCSVVGGGYCCDTECYALNCWLELLFLLLMLSSFLGPGFSIDTYANAPGTLGICNIENPTVCETTSGKCDTASAYNRLYFGSKDNSPLYWRVLNTTANDNNSTPALFMLTEYLLPKVRWDPSKHQYTDTEIDRYLRTDSPGNVYYDYFNSQEKSVILETNKHESGTGPENRSWGGNTTAYGAPLLGFKVFLLSASEVLTREYGFSSESRNGENYCDVNKACLNTNNCYGWWTRSVCNNYNTSVARVTYTGNCTDHNSSNLNDGARFAINIPLSYILFAQDANSTASTSSPTFTVIPSVLTRTKFKYDTAAEPAPLQIYTVKYDQDIPCTVPTPPGAKLTIVDNSRNDFAIDEELLFCDIGGSIDIHYTGACTGSNEFISAIIKNVNGNQYHARLCSVDKSSGKITMSIPSELPYGEYTLILYNEKETGPYLTNYAGYDTKTLIISDITKPIVTNAYRNNTNTYFKFNASDNTELCKVTDSTMQNLLTLHGNKTTKNMPCSEQTDLYVEDIFGNRTKLQDISIDDTCSDVIISYSDGTYTLTISDNESGVWKITNRDGTVVYSDYSC